MILKDRIDKILVERKIVKNRNEALGALRANDFNLNGAVELLLASQFA